MSSNRSQFRALAKSLTSTQEEMTPEVNAVKTDQQNGSTKYKYRKNNREKRHPQNETVMCGRCGGKHGEQQICPAIGATCHKCKKLNRYSKMCKTRLTNERKVHGQTPTAKAMIFSLAPSTHKTKTKNGQHR